MLDTRRSQASSKSEEDLDDEDLNGIEQMVNDIMIKMIYKLNDSYYRPLFIAQLEWATTGLPNKDKKGLVSRQIAFYGFLHVFFDTLKVCCMISRQ